MNPSPEFAVIGTHPVFLDLFAGFPGCVGFCLMPLLSEVERLPRTSTGPPRTTRWDVDILRRVADYWDLVRRSVGLDNLDLAISR